VRRARLALLALAVGAFGIGTNEFVIMGLLPNVAGDVGVSIPTAGGLISGYALGVVIGAPLLTVAANRLPRKAALVLFMSWFAVGNLLSALAPSYGLLFAARVFAGLPHGAYFGVGSIVAASLVEPDRRARAMAKMFMGLTIANVVGVPLTTLLGQHLGWRAAFVLVTLIGAVAVGAVLLAVPHQGAPAAGGRLRAEFAAMRAPQLWLTVAISVFGFAGMFASFSYVTPMMTDLAGYSPGAVTFLLALFGLGLTVGNAVGARFADRNHGRTLWVAIALLVVVLLVFTFTAHSAVGAPITVFLVGATGIAVTSPLSLRVLEQAPGAPTLALATVQSALNIANSLGAYLGGVVIAAGFGLAAPNWAGAISGLVGLALAGVAVRTGRSSATPAQPAATTATAR
jgi:MFS transporter, DHA1 family, inner membrane transport protein